MERYDVCYLDTVPGGIQKYPWRVAVTWFALDILQTFASTSMWRNYYRNLGIHWNGLLIAFAKASNGQAVVRQLCANFLIQPFLGWAEYYLIVPSFTGVNRIQPLRGSFFDQQMIYDQ